ncbi:unnamed protein product [Aphanomyces euteiches]|uniref:N-acetyltransferase domain-containing protein n=1 Tax=Aphanomyces euteiches TaxID=100861 RepID=A0A6G0XT73_9STRA|nr:hypothetical protein Ae201684_001750 [Aphanomyces euteiches]KAH9075245.1 hypothetical protein Ae201684P_003927 [Aphanomyces euteiches]KAH9142724.1 hypothetical protein AeRB84_013220 [Aphanomyces euteiches]
MDSNYELIDLYHAYDAALLDRFYVDVLEPCFGVSPDGLESVGVMHRQLAHGNHAPNEAHVLHIAVVKDKTTGVIVAGVSFEYYKRSNCGLVAYLATNPNIDTRRMNLGVYLAAHCADVIIPYEAQRHGYKYCDAAFVESHSDSVEHDTMVPAHRRSILATKIGIRYLAFDYVTPRLESGKQKCRHMYLGVETRFCLRENGKDIGMDSSIVAAFLIDYYNVAMGSEAAACDIDIQRQLKWLAANPVLPLIETTAFQPVARL